MVGINDDQITDLKEELLRIKAHIAASTSCSEAKRCVVNEISRRSSSDVVLGSYRDLDLPLQLGLPQVESRRAPPGPRPFMVALLDMLQIC